MKEIHVLIQEYGYITQVLNLETRQIEMVCNIDIRIIRDLFFRLHIVNEKFKDLTIPQNLIYPELDFYETLPFLLFSELPETIFSYLNQSKNIKELKKKAHNLYLDNYLKKCVTIFGTDEAQKEIGTSDISKLQIEKINENTKNISSIRLPCFFKTKFRFARNFCYKNNSGVPAVGQKLERSILATFNAFNLFTRISIRRAISNPGKSALAKNIYFPALGQFIEETTPNLLTKDGLELFNDLKLFYQMNLVK